MCKSWAQIVRAQRIVGGYGIHRAESVLWMNKTTADLSPTMSTAVPTLCTQIVHRPVDKTTSVTRHFSATSTAPITTTTIFKYI